ncbi:Nucleic acid-binding protein [Corchorus olitorius]|uniref:Nucleic acid-binding protein n=1 Tax=Corchorus olitorius TaxID=93759 RepID=A0A1R3IW86_9ROSI|nr:Nucleic acid-binding protein [Corchorus olitorius]
MNQLSIASLFPTEDIQTIRLKVARIWRCILPISREPVGLAFVGVDYRGQGIHIHTNEAEVDLFRPIITEGYLYQNTAFRVVVPEIENIATQTTYIMVFNAETIIQQVPDRIELYNRYYFNFNFDTRLEDQWIWERNLSDVIGIIRSISMTSHLKFPRGIQTSKHDLHLISLNGKELKSTLWEPFYNEIDIPKIMNTTPRSAVIFSGMKVRYFEGAATLSTCAATKIYVDLNIQETTRGNGIHVQIFESHAHLFKGRLIEGNIYQITDFKVSNVEIPNISTQAPYIILFHVDTVIQQASDSSGVYARHFFDFTGENIFDDEKRWEIHLTGSIKYDPPPPPCLDLALTLVEAYSNTFEEASPEPKTKASDLSDPMSKGAAVWGNRKSKGKIRRKKGGYRNGEPPERCAELAYGVHLGANQWLPWTVALHVSILIYLKMHKCMLEENDMSLECFGLVCNKMQQRMLVSAAEN